MSTDQPYSLRFTRHAVRDLDAMFTYITYELDAAPPRRPATTCWPAKATAR